MIVEILKFFIYSFLIVLISKYVLVTTIRNLAENLNLKSKTVGNIAGISTSIPELLTITTSSLRGLMGASIYNVFSSNVINLIQYLTTVIMNKNTKKLKNNAIIFDMILVVITIIIPIILLWFNIKLDMFIVPLFVLMYLLFVVLNNNVHRTYLENQEIIESNKNYDRKYNIKLIIMYSAILIIIGLLLYIISNLLGNTLEKICYTFNISEIIVGILLGFITSIPELLTFFESQKHHNKAKNEMHGVVEATNNLLTSNILNLFVIQTIGILIINI